MLLALSMCIHDHENETDRILAILSGETLNAVTHLNITLIIVVSTSVILLYTSKGGLASVLYTDVLQLCSTIMGLWCCVPFVARYGAVAKVSEAQKDWVGVISNNDLSQILDQLLMTIFGGIPWQVYFQRVLSSDSAFTAKMLSFLSAVGCVFLSLPPVIVGASGKSASNRGGAVHCASMYPVVGRCAGDDRGSERAVRVCAVDSLLGPCLRAALPTVHRAVFHAQQDQRVRCRGGLRDRPDDAGPVWRAANRHPRSAEAAPVRRKPRSAVPFPDIVHAAEPGQRACLLGVRRLPVSLGPPGGAARRVVLLPRAVERRGSDGPQRLLDERAFQRHCPLQPEHAGARTKRRPARSHRHGRHRTAAERERRSIFGSVACHLRRQGEDDLPVGPCVEQAPTELWCSCGAGVHPGSAEKQTVIGRGVEVLRSTRRRASEGCQAQGAGCFGGRAKGSPDVQQEAERSGRAASQDA
ncbi:uncharacterized protein LOC142814206 isoform X2 [Rhipicephalus microplus]|uniref:uncharacterized protein LOC142814206 isoform X2 n=1 Tax=Rhipicephalus microplus TaxID=6941 RepID=UPI003F6B7C6A